jgi:hypothetical protein
MAGRVVLGTKYASEVSNLVFDFASRMLIGNTILSATTVATVYSGTDPSPPSISTSFSGTKVTGLITGGVVGVTYLIKCTITTGAQTLSLEGYLVVISDTQ